MRFTLAVVLFATLAACSATPPDDRASDESQNSSPRALPGPSEQGGSGELAEQELCDAIDYRILVGTSVDDTTFPVGPRLRVFGANDIVTQDYIPQRTNVVYDAARKVIRVYCG